MASSSTTQFPEGTIQGGSAASQIASVTGSSGGTLDEPVKETIMRDVRSVQRKLLYVMLPRARSESGGELKQWDLWGPLILCLALSILLWWGAHEEQKRIVFTLVFAIIWLGSAVVTANAVLLSGTVSFFQSVCVLGYCIFPIDVAAFISHFIPAKVAFIKFILMLAALHWATGASVAFLSEVVPAEKKLLAIYPVWLFYLSIAWLVLLV